MCQKCNCKSFKSFDELHICCINCGTLKYIGQPETMATPAGIECAYNQRNNIFEVNAAATAHMDQVIDQVRHLIALGRTWKFITAKLEFPCHHKTARNAYEKRITEDATSGREAMFDIIKADFEAKVDKIMELRRSGVALRKIIASLDMKGAHSTISRMVREREAA